MENDSRSLPVLDIVSLEGSVKAGLICIAFFCLLGLCSTFEFGITVQLTEYHAVYEVIVWADPNSYNLLILPKWLITLDEEVNSLQAAACSH